MPILENSQSFPIMDTSGVQSLGGLLTSGVHNVQKLFPSSSASSNSFNGDDPYVTNFMNWVDTLVRNESQQLDKNMAYNAEQAAITRRYNSEEAAKLRQWQEKMSNTSYQRAMQDMMKAGLNPILAFQQGGATVPSGSSASANNASMSTGGGMSVSDLASVFSSIIKIIPGLASLFLALGA